MSVRAAWVRTHAAVLCLASLVVAIPAVALTLAVAADRMPARFATPMSGGYPSACAQPSSCDPAVDSVCTIVETGERLGVDPAVIGMGVRAHRYRASDFAACPQHRHYLSEPESD